MVPIGDQAMGTVKRTPGWALLALALVLLPSLAAARAPAPEDDPKLKEKALSLNKITGDEAEADKIKELIKDEANTKKLLAVASNMAKEKKQPFNTTATLVLARVAEVLKEPDIAEQFYRLNVAQAEKIGGKKLILGYAGLISVLYNNKKYAEAEKACHAFLEGEQDDTTKQFAPRIERQMILAVVMQKDADRALKMIDTRVKDNSDNWNLLKFKAQIQHQLDKNDDALKTYEQVGEKIKKDDRLTKGEQEKFLDDLLYEQTGIYVDKNDIKKATDILEKLLEKHPDDPTYNNDLGFILADHDMRLEESEKMIRKALEEDKKKRKANPDLQPDEDKDNAAYLDSLGWVLFKQKKYKEAKPYLVDALKDEDGQHVEIFDHLGDVQMALGEKKEAIQTYKKGIEAAGPSKREQERKAMIEKKLKDLEK
jgi:tetratricopeptide (TPR) repeat protein